ARFGKHTAIEPKTHQRAEGVHQHIRYRVAVMRVPLVDQPLALAVGEKVELFETSVRGGADQVEYHAQLSEMLIDFSFAVERGIRLDLQDQAPAVRIRVDVHIEIIDGTCSEVASDPGVPAEREVDGKGLDVDGRAE